MTSFDSGRTLADRFRGHAGSHTHLYGYAMRAMADDWEAGGPVREVCAGYEQVPKAAALQLRLLAGIFRIVLTGRAPELVPYYPCLGGFEAPALAWPALRKIIAEHVEELHDALETPPQTNEVGRCAALLAGLFDLVGAADVHRVRLLEVGASAGLNLLLDGYAVSGDGWSWGQAGSAVRLGAAIIGPVTLRPFTIDARRGCDLHPVDVTTQAGRIKLTSFVWPFDVQRHQRLAAALDVAQRTPPVVDQASAGAWLEQQLRGHVAADTLTVVWQSITRLYWPADEVRAVEQVLRRAGTRLLLGHLSMEYPLDGPSDAGPEVVTQLWRPGSSHPVRRRFVGTAHDHGIPVRLST